MSIDELAAQAKDGDEETLLTLWAQVKRFGFWIGKQYGLDADDKSQAAFEALIHTVQIFEPEKGTFLTAYKFALHSAFLAAKYGGRSEKVINDPLNAAISLDAPASEDAETPLGDLIAVETDFSDVERREQAQAVQDAIAQLTEPEQAVILCRFFQNLTRVDTAAALRISAAEVRKTESAALRRLRRPDISRKLQSYL